MKDLIKEAYLKVKKRKKTNLSLLKRYLRIKFKINIDEPNLKTRVNNYEK